MRIPPSVIVMSLLTAVPFGLGIRDALSKKEHSAGEYGDDFDVRRSERERQRELEEYEAALREEALRREAEKQAPLPGRYAPLEGLFGPDAASMGPLLEGIVLGAPADSVEAGETRERIQHLHDGGLVELQFGTYKGVVEEVEVYIKTDLDDDATCPAFGNKLEAAWGLPTNGVWRDLEKRHRASFDHCTLKFERYVEPADWVAALPFDLIGVRRDKLLETFVGSDGTDDRVFWSAPGVGIANRATELWAHIENNRVVGIQARVRTDADSAVAVREALLAKLSAQPEHDEANRSWTWKLRVPVVFEELEREIIVSIGKMP